MASLTQIHETHYYSVIFTSILNQDHTGYFEMADRMEQLATRQPGFLGLESACGEDGVGITVSYWKDEASIIAWKNNLDHLQAQKPGQEKWYKQYRLHISRVERTYHFNRFE